MFNYDTLTEAVNGLRQRGYTLDFNLESDRIRCQKTPLSLLPDEFEIMEFYRFEGNSDPADESVIYAIESHHGQKGLLVNGFGVSSDGLDDKMVEKLKFRHV